MWFLPLLQRFWKPLAVVIAIGGVLLFVYLKGRSNALRKAENAAFKDTIERIEKTEKVRIRNRETKRRINEKIRNPDTSIHDVATDLSVHLSSDPTED